jgi:hypothetical protein
LVVVPKKKNEVPVDELLKPFDDDKQEEQASEEKKAIEKNKAIIKAKK